jgi:hypothetical protein
MNNEYNIFNNYIKIDDSSLEKELEICRNNLYNEQIEFENVIKEEEGFTNKMYDIIINKPKYVYDYTYINNYNLLKLGDNISYDFLLKRQFDIISNIYIELEIDDLFNLSIQERYNILSSEIHMTAGGTNILSFNLLTSIFLSICQGKNIKQDNNIIQIEIINFEKLIKKNSKNIIYGIKLPFYQETKITITMKCIKNLKIRLLIHGAYYDSNNLRDIYTGEHNLFIMTNNLYRYRYGLIKNHSYQLNFVLTDFILIFYLPNKDNNDNFIIKYPEINNVRLVKIKEEYHWNETNILTFQIFDIVIYVLPTSSELYSWEKIMEKMKEPENDSWEKIEKKYKKNTNFENLSQVVNNKYTLHIESINEEFFDICLCTINKNVLSFVEGMVDIKYK